MDIVSSSCHFFLWSRRPADAGGDHTASSPEEATAELEFVTTQSGSKLGMLGAYNVKRVIAILRRRAVAIGDPSLSARVSRQPTLPLQMFEPTCL